MQLTVLGATGGTGRHLVQQALDAGHEVTAVVRDPARLHLGAHPSLEVFPAALTEPGQLLAALRGRDAVLSGLGGKPPVAQRTAAVVLDAMREAGVRRLLAVSAAPVGPVPPEEGPLFRAVLNPLVRFAFRHVYADLAAMERRLRESGTEWTAVRPPRLLDWPFTGRYRTCVGGSVPRRHTVSRADLACAMLAMVEDRATFRQPVGVASA
ncbi:SDR family oxidoreductase [Streptomyces sp. 549]|uniref:NAD(P)-dependent oxidoreductase n=1 Tax=Streptomyces sp. 549 TaxID=3049076 RepID=UPI0024C2B5CA|nr:SDR family oxidoreductase [Streptomyces sp. 549]MDK1472938.1 SDR family oxidoreductase [Streptomyces sp. 549]